MSGDFEVGVVAGGLPKLTGGSCSRACDLRKSSSEVTVEVKEERKGGRMKDDGVPFEVMLRGDTTLGILCKSSLIGESGDGLLRLLEQVKNEKK